MLAASRARLLRGHRGDAISWLLIAMANVCSGAVAVIGCTSSAAVTADGPPNMAAEAGTDTTTVTFADPNPMPCQGGNAATTCRAGWVDPSGGQIQWTGCCLTDFSQNPDGKCGISENGGACVERFAPGNLDTNCSSGTWSMQNIIGRGAGCCMWRSTAPGNTCGVLSKEYGCIQIDQVIFRLPCTPDYTMGYVKPPNP